MATLRELKGRIGSVASSEKITGAMKMISSAKMHKAEMMLKQLVPFRGQIEGIIANLISTEATFASPLLESREVKHVTVVVWGSDDGLCGAYNVNIYKRLIELLGETRNECGDGVEIEIITIGSKVAKACSRINLTGVTTRAIEGIDSKSGSESVKRLMTELTETYRAGKTDRVNLLYMHFKSVSRQNAQVDCFLPVTADAFGSMTTSTGVRPCLFEPDANTIFNVVLPLYLIAVIEEVFGENRASEQAARVMAMQSANDNAKKLLDQLKLEFNKLRQQSITTELLDIVGGQVR